jgi:hypothetical protein
MKGKRTSVFMDIKEIKCDDLDWTELAQDMV